MVMFIQTLFIVRKPAVTLLTLQVLVFHEEWFRLPAPSLHCEKQNYLYVSWKQLAWQWLWSATKHEYISWKCFRYMSICQTSKKRSNTSSIAVKGFCVASKYSWQPIFCGILNLWSQPLTQFRPVRILYLNNLTKETAIDLHDYHYLEL